MKKIYSIILICSLLVAQFIITPPMNSVKAAGFVHGTTQSSATLLPENQTVTDYYNGGTHWWAYTSTSDGYIVPNFRYTAQNKISNAAYLTFSVYEAGDSGTTLNFKFDYSDWGRTKDYVLSAEKGKTYYFKLYSGTSSLKFNYDIKIRHTAADNWEKENNNSFTSANEIKRDIYGSLDGKNDSDYYIVKLDNDEPLRFYLDLSMTEAENFTEDVDVWVYDSNGNRYSSRGAGYDLDRTRGSVDLNYGTMKAGTYYIRITTYLGSSGLDRRYFILYHILLENDDPINPTRMYRLYNPNSGEHFYTGSEVERNNLAAIGWKYEGEAWTAPDFSLVPVWRLYNPNTGDHHYTPSLPERNNLINSGWNDEWIGWYAGSEDGTPVYRAYNPNATGAGSHHYTTDITEYNHLCQIGWTGENVGWYGL